MTNARRRIDVAADPVRDPHRDALRFGRRIREAVYQRILSIREYLCGLFNAFRDARRLPVNQTGRSLFNFMIQKPAVAQNAGTLGLQNLMALHREVDIVANTTTKRAGGVSD